MPTTPTFARLSIDQFEPLLRRFEFTRRINAVHMHHTWRPRHADFEGHETIVAMWRHHTQANGWRDIAQHLTIDPEGFLWLGRNWNLPPASAAGHNGNAAFGPFMFEMIGDFDAGRDRFEGEQRRSAVEVVALLQQQFDLPLQSLRLHNMMSPKSCPGTGVDFIEVLAEIDAARQRLKGRSRVARQPAHTPFPDEQSLAVAQALRALQRIPDGSEPADAELVHDESAPAEVAAPQPGSGRADGPSGQRGAGLDAGTLAALRPHLVNLTMGRLSTRGEVSSTPADVAAIFEQHLPAAVAEAKADGRRLPVLFFAHGGLVSESSGLQIAHKHVDWWRRNGVYPIYFIWETGLFETIAQLLSRARQRGRDLTRDLFDFTSDPLIEIAVRALQAPRIWAGMKSAAEHAVDAPTPADTVGGGGAYTATLLKAFCDAHGADVELHAVGHSAGSIFHSYFLPTAQQLGVPPFKSAHFLAPAARCDLFKTQLMPHVGPGRAIESLTVITMTRDFERDDHCARIYRKSLLYLVHRALEDQPQTPILGLEESLRDDPELKRFFGLGVEPAQAAAVVWSPSPSDSGRSASRSLTHGGFDDDASTMNSVARRILGRADADEVVEYAAARAVARDWSDEVDWPAPLDGPARPPVPTPVPPAAAPPPPAAGPTPPGAAAGGRRRALCIGIDRYPNPEHRLAGCVNDARRWSDALRGFGFEARLLLDDEASRDAIERELRRLIEGSGPGDVLVVQYAGHGTQVPDLDGDETDGNDEALCPVDFADGALFIDDDLARVLAATGDGVNLTCFMDCCHSGTNTRFAVGSSQPRAPLDAKARFVVATPAIVAAHEAFRRRLPAAPRAAAAAAGATMRDVKFSACLDHEVAWESGGSGEFTLRSMQVLTGGIDGLSNEQFVQRVVAAFGSGARQRPMLDCAGGAGQRGLLQPLVGAEAPAPRADAGEPARAAGTAQALHLLAQAMQALTAR